MARDFSKLIEGLPNDLSVLDVGGFGLEGENTSHALAKKFKDITVVNKQAEVIERYQKEFPHITFINALYEDTELPLYDLVVFDSGIESQMRMWDTLDVPVKKNGHLAAYFILTDQYGDENTPKQIREHWNRLANRDINWQLIRFLTEERRPEILWLLLKRTDG